VGGTTGAVAGGLAGIVNGIVFGLDKIISNRRSKSINQLNQLLKYNELL
jgi:hypothetical protein